ncbi:hypothetical protein HG263_16470 [Pseudoalteromonas sp. JBTF-M23]|uniref:Methyl-accepting chemotaxis protein n=1 Tax=Pseudoalteromonas caenipelagi TaxID=2726988 RepID=A0A849VEI4_9GAMM|nr:hypothetical protein [Pseudoalteromonas caenipelagi]NOU52129.1 hypothetical protein [Pseudoalteromonas caenipelagi]
MIGSISNSITETQAQNLQLSEAASLQEGLIRELSARIADIRNVTSNNNASAAETLKAAEEINQAVKEINEQLHKFTR